MIFGNNADEEIIWFLCNAHALLEHTKPKLESIIAYRQLAGIEMRSFKFYISLFVSSQFIWKGKRVRGKKRGTKLKGGGK